MSDIDEKLQDSSKSSENSKYAIDEFQVGIWKLFIAKQKWQPQGLWPNIWEAYPLVIRLFIDIYKIAPRILYLVILSKFWGGIKTALDMRYENIILSQIELALSTRTANVYDIGFAIGGKVSISLISSCIRWSDENVMPVLKARLEHHYQLELMKSQINKDMPTSTETSERVVGSDTAWSSLEKILDMFQLFFELFTQLWFLLNLTRVRGSNTLFLTFVAQAMFAQLSTSALWRQSFFAYINHESHKRVKSLEKFADGSFLQDIISNNIGTWVITEYRKAYASLGDSSTDDLYGQFRKKSPFFVIFQDLLGDLPTIYFALLVLNSPKNISIASVASFQYTGRWLFYGFRRLIYEYDEAREALNDLKKMYQPPNSNIMKDGSFEYPSSATDDSSKGMSFVLKDLSFAYPTGGKKVDVLKGIDLDIKAGQLVVVVGANGSGKSTLTRILARLYDPSSGQLLVDGRPSSEYRIGDLQRATAILSQDNQIYPLTLAENIGLGYPEHSSNLEMIKEAASEGGAGEFIEALENGYDTMLDTFDSSFHMNLKGNREHPLWIMSDKLTKKSDISGGQRQRVIAARTFMRFKSGHVKFVVVDEPSSALDADGELQLFRRLLDVREGKTMVFVTHRFGHLTKFADQIICMKDAQIVETGSHAELMSMDGEYAKLYKIQAQAFSDSVDTPKANGHATKVS